MKVLNYIFKLSLCLLFVFAFEQFTTAQVTSLKVIPEVQNFTAKNGMYSIPNSVNIIVSGDKNDSLKHIATQLKEELHTMFQIQATVTTSNTVQSASQNEILLTYSDVTLKNREAYTLDFNQNSGATIKGATRDGAFWATRTLLQLAENHKNSIPCGLITDYPDYPSRGFMLDVGRKFFTIDYLRSYVKILSYYKMNEFHVHLNDNGFKSYYGNDWSKTYAAFRLESTTYPGLAAEDGHYTKEEFRNLQLLGMQYGVNVIPEIDIPAHSLAFTRYNPELKASAPYADDHLDILNDAKLPKIYEFFDKLFDEYIKGENPTFVGKDVHIGTDEFVKEGQIRNVDNAQSKRFREFTNHYLKYIADLGKTPRLWGGLEWLKDSPLTPVPAVGGAVMNAWSKDWVNAEQMLKDGFKIISTPDTWLYIVPAAGYYQDFLDIQWIYNNYRPEKVNYALTLPDFKSGLLGSTFAVWNDICGNGISQLDVHYRTIPAVKAFGTKNWKVKPNRSYADFEVLANEMSDAPSENLSGAYSDEELETIASKVGETPINFDGTKELELGGTDLGFKYDVSFDLKVAQGNKHNAILFQSKYGALILNTKGIRRLGFTRDGYVNMFPFVPKTDVWQRFRFVGDKNSVTLYVDGVKKSTLTTYKKDTGLPRGINYTQTLHFPLEKIGDDENGFKGEIKNLKMAYFDELELKRMFLSTKVQIEDGLYYIKLDDRYLTNTLPKGQAPTFQPKSADVKTQQFKISRVNSVNRYKIVSGTDETKYVNEIGDFGKNPYSDDWNTYHFYKKDGLFAIQNDGHSGRGFWYIADNNRFKRGNEKYDDSNYIVQIIPVSTGMDNVDIPHLDVSVNSEELMVVGEELSKMWLYHQDGSLEVTKVGTNKISKSLLPLGTYLLKVETKSGKKGTLKVVL